MSGNVTTRYEFASMKDLARHLETQAKAALYQAENVVRPKYRAKQLRARADGLQLAARIVANSVIKGDV